MKIKEGSWVLQKNKERAESFPRLYPPVGTLGVVNSISQTGYMVQWNKEGFSQALYPYMEEDLLYIGIPDQYRYRYNLNNPTVMEWFEKYKVKHNLHQNYPPSDQQRFEFERGMDKLLLMGRIRPEEVFK